MDEPAKLQLESTEKQPKEKKFSATDQVTGVKNSTRKLAESGAQPHPRAKTPRKHPEGTCS